MAKTLSISHGLGEMFSAPCLIRSIRWWIQRIQGAGLLAWALGLTPLVTGSEAASATNAQPADAVVVLPRSVDDPMEPFNRAMWAFNRGLMSGVIEPSSRVYRLVVVKPVRTGIANFSKNLVYPRRLINNLLQGKWTGARDESYRFVCNSTVGVAGIFDVARRWKIPKSEADFGETFGQWGWKPGCYLMLPFFGPSNERDALGLAADTAANPLLYISPYRLVAGNPLTYLGPYTYFTYAAMYNELSDSVSEYVRFSEATMDPYAEVQYAWTFVRKNRVADFQVKGEQDQASLETLQSVFFGFKDPAFPGRGRTGSVLIPSTGRRLKFTSWLQPGPAPVIYILPGLGSHRLAQTSLALAELVHRHGYSAVCVSSAFHSEFMEHASTAAMPAFLPVDGRDLHVAVAEIDKQLRGLFPHRLGDKALLGYSMGAFHSLFIAGTERTNRTSLPSFDRYVAINTPVRLLQGMERLDEFYRAPLSWPAAERTDSIENTFLKVAALSRSTLTPETSLPFNAVESKFLIGLTFRLILRDVIYSSQRRNSQGVLRHSTRTLRRAPVYDEIVQFSYLDYLNKLAVPYFEGQGMTAPAAEVLDHAGDLRTYQAGLSANPNVRILVNQNDFLLAERDLEWLRATFGSDRLTVFPQGGHLGNLAHPRIQESILNALSGLQPAVAGSR